MNPEIEIIRAQIRDLHAEHFRMNQVTNNSMSSGPERREILSGIRQRHAMQMTAIRAELSRAVIADMRNRPTTQSEEMEEIRSLSANGESRPSSTIETFASDDSSSAVSANRRTIPSDNLEPVEDEPVAVKKKPAFKKKVVRKKTAKKKTAEALRMGFVRYEDDMNLKTVAKTTPAPAFSIKKSSNGEFSPVLPGSKASGVKVPTSRKVPYSAYRKVLDSCDPLTSAGGIPIQGHFGLSSRRFNVEPTQETSSYLKRPSFFGINSKMSPLVSNPWEESVPRGASFMAYKTPDNFLSSGFLVMQEGLSCKVAAYVELSYIDVAVALSANLDGEVRLGYGGNLVLSESHPLRFPTIPEENVSVFLVATAWGSSESRDPTEVLLFLVADGKPHVIPLHNFYESGTVCMGESWQYRSDLLQIMGLKLESDYTLMGSLRGAITILRDAPPNGDLAKGTKRLREGIVFDKDLLPDPKITSKMITNRDLGSFSPCSHMVISKILELNKYNPTKPKTKKKS